VTSFDVLIVGGGPAGATCAWALRRAGLDVLVRDRARFPREKPCAGWVTPGVFRMLELDPAEYSAGGRTCQAIRGFVVGREGGHAVQTRFPDVVSHGICRCEFDAFLLERSGARVDSGGPVRSIHRDAAGWVLDETYRAPLLIGAGGHFCPVARVLGARPGSGESAIIAQEVEYRLDPASASVCPVDPELPELTFCRDLRGYGWCFRKGDVLNVGLGRWGASGERLGAHVAEFLSVLVRRGRIPGLPPRRMTGHAYVPARVTSRRLLYDGVMLVGDSAGTACPESGEGIAPAIESALMAATTAIEAAGHYQSARLESYRRRICARFGKPARKLRVPALALTPWLLPVAGLLLSRGWFSREIVMKRWFLHATLPDFSERPWALGSDGLHERGMVHH
jgi:flavin-dependent dehydrogenase